MKPNSERNHMPTRRNNVELLHSCLPVNDRSYCIAAVNCKKKQKPQGEKKAIDNIYLTIVSAIFTN